MTRAACELRVAPLTPELWPAMEELLGGGGPCSRCWCMYWRVGPRYRKREPGENKAALHAAVVDGPPPGLLAFAGEAAVGWCQLTPRVALPRLEKTLHLGAAVDASVWAVSCFYVRKGYRRRGVTKALVNAAIVAAREAGARELEAYPLDVEVTSSTSFTGYKSTFLRAGFTVFAQDGTARPLMRLRL